MARRATPSQPNALVAAAKVIDLSNRRLAQKQATPPEKWQKEAWAYFYEVPELGESLTYRGDQLAKLRLFVAVENPTDPKGDPVPVTDEASGVPAPVAAAASDELARLRGEFGGQAEVIRQLSVNIDVAGEAYLVGIGAHAEIQSISGVETEVEVPESWTIKSISEVVEQGGVYKIKRGPDDMDPIPLVAGRDDIMRLWLRDPQWSNRPHSPTRGLLGECRTLQVLTQQVLAQAMRSVSAGLFVVANELSFGPENPTAPDEDGAAEGDPLNQALNDILVRPIDNPSDPSTVQPGVLRGPAEFIGPDMLRRISFYDSDMDTVLEAKIEARVQRIARGINLPVEVVMGLQQTTFANAATIDRKEFDNYLRPSADVTMDNLTFAFLTPQLVANPAVGPEWAERMFVWYDPSELISQPDKEKNAELAFDRYAISLASYRAAKGYGDDDAPDEVEMLIRAGLRRGLIGSDITEALLDLLGVPIEVDAAPEGDGEAPAPDTDARSALLQLLTGSQPACTNGHTLDLPASAVRTVSAAGQRDYGRALMDLDRELRTALVVAANDAMSRALERAGNVLRSRALRTDLRATLRNVPARQSFAHLGATLVAQVMEDDDPLEGAWDALGLLFAAWGGVTQERALDLASEASGGFSATERSVIEERQAEDLSNAWTWFAGALGVLALARLYDPDPAAPEVGEHDPMLRVPTGMVRQAIARAGGATGLSATEVGGDFVTLADAGTRPAGGIGTGELLHTEMRDAGVQFKGYRWVYGPGLRRQNFQPHLSLDGQEFASYDSPEMVNGSGWPPFGFYFPGDHFGCQCDSVPFLIPADTPVVLPVSEMP